MRDSTRQSLQDRGGGNLVVGNSIRKLAQCLEESPLNHLEDPLEVP